jgi:hypothetical protein
MHCCQEGLRNTRLVTSQSESSQMKFLRRLELLARCITYEIHKHRDTCFVEGYCFLDERVKL